MQKNMGRTDRTIRVLAGLVLLGAAVAVPTWWGLLGLIPIATAIVGWCPAYAPLGMDTLRHEQCTPCSKRANTEC